MKKPIVVAGNGPSLAKIDYRRLPADFDVFRCNQFYFEEKYYLGKKITGAFVNGNVIKPQYFTLRTLNEREEYNINQIYLTPHREWPEEKEYPKIKNTFSILESYPDFCEFISFLSVYYKKVVTSTIYMLMTAAALGYKEIYLVGLDFYEGGGEITLLIRLNRSC